MAPVPWFRELYVLLLAAILLCAARLALWILSFAKLRRVVTSLTHPRFRSPHRYSADQLSWAVRSVCPYVPHATCLTQALALHILLRREGLQSSIRIGVSKDADHFEAHAWVESHGRVVIGDFGLARYNPMMIWD
jgi:Transglutaminase-like superfamily